MSDKQRTEFDAALEAALQIQHAHSFGMAEGEFTSVPFVVLANGQQAHSLEHLLDQPRLRKAEVTLNDVESFCAYVTAFGQPERTRLFAAAEGQNQQVVALLDYHGAGPDGVASWCRHQAKLVLTPSREWRAWGAVSNVPFSQIAFAEFLEDHLPDIREPDGATVLEACRHLEAKKTTLFKRGVNLHDGTIKFEYDETVEGRGKGTLNVPARFTLGIPVFEHGDPYAVAARLRFRLADDKLTFVFILDQPEQIVQGAFADVCQEIETATGIKPFRGKVAGLGR